MKQAFIFLTALVLGTGIAFAQEEVPAFSELDADQDGLVSQEEANISEAVASNFAAADADMDGYLNQEEFDELVTKIG